MDFYDTVTEENAKDWYDSLPAHLRKQVDSAVDAETKADHFEIQKLDSVISQMTTKAAGYDLPAHVIVNHTVDGNTMEEIERFERRKVWCTKYNELLRQGFVLSMAPRMQKERKMLSQALGLTQGGNGFPDQTDGLDDVTAATVNWITSSGETPLEYLAGVYRDGDSETKTSDRIAAARALMEYVHRKLPTKTEVKTDAPQVVDLSQLRNLTTKELDILEGLLKKGAE